MMKDLNENQVSDTEMFNLRAVIGYIKSVLPQCREALSLSLPFQNELPWHGFKRAHRNYPWAGAMPVIYIKGHPYEMGFQYGQKSKPLIPLIAERYREIILSGSMYSGKKDLMIANINQYESSVQEIFGQEYIDEMHGIADGAEVFYEDILLLMCRSDLIMPQFEQMLNQNEGCISWSAWGDATSAENGIMIATHNTEGGRSPGMYQLIVVAEPDNGHSFICSIFAGELAHHCGYLNDAGVFVSMSALRGSKKEEMNFVPYTPIVRYLAQNSASAQKGYELLLNLVEKGHFGSGAANVELADERNAIYVQVTPAKCSNLKKPEGDGFVLATDNPPHEEMLPHLTTKLVKSPKREGWLSLIRENFGKIDIWRALTMMGSHKDWNTGEEKAGFNSLCIHGEAIGQYFGTKGSNVAIPTERGMFVAAEPCVACEEQNWRYIAFNKACTIADLPGLFVKGAYAWLVIGPDEETAKRVLDDRDHDLIIIGSEDSNRVTAHLKDHMQNLPISMSIDANSGSIESLNHIIRWNKDSQEIFHNGDRIGLGPGSKEYNVDAALIATIREKDRYILVISGFGYKGAMAAAMLLGDYERLIGLREQSALIIWKDNNGNGLIEEEEIHAVDCCT